VERGARVRLLRDQVVVYDGKIASLRRFKDDVKEVKAGFECGIGIENFNDIKVNDVLEFYELHEVKPTLDLEPENAPGPRTSLVASRMTDLWRGFPCNRCWVPDHGGWWMFGLGSLWRKRPRTRNL